MGTLAKTRSLLWCIPLLLLPLDAVATTELSLTGELDYEGLTSFQRCHFFGNGICGVSPSVTGSDGTTISTSFLADVATTPASIDAHFMSGDVNFDNFFPPVPPAPIPDFNRFGDLFVSGSLSGHLPPGSHDEVARLFFGDVLTNCEASGQDSLTFAFAGRNLPLSPVAATFSPCGDGGGTESIVYETPQLLLGGSALPYSLTAQLRAFGGGQFPPFEGLVSWSVANEGPAFSVVPEPSSWILLATALSLLLIVMSKHKSRDSRKVRA